jgi:hypothetical protein
MVSPTRIEVRGQSGWVKSSYPIKTDSTTLAPAESRIITIDLESSGPMIPWRIVFSTTTMLDGWRASHRKLMLWPRLIYYRLRSGNSGIPWIPFSSRIQVSSEPVEITTEELAPP